MYILGSMGYTLLLFIVLVTIFQYQLFFFNTWYYNFKSNQIIKHSIQSTLSFYLIHLPHSNIQWLPQLRDISVIFDISVTKMRGHNISGFTHGNIREYMKPHNPLVALPTTKPRGRHKTWWRATMWRDLVTNITLTQRNPKTSSLRKLNIFY